MPRSRSQWPVSLERSLGAHLRRRQKLIRQLVLSTLEATPRRHTDADEPTANPYVGWLQSAIDRLRTALSTAAPLAPSVVRRWAVSIDTAVSAGIARTLGLLAATAPPTALVKAPSTALLVAESAWISDTVGRVSALESDTIARALTAAWAAAEAGESPERAARAVLDGAEARALLTARDAIGIYAASVARTRGPQMGATEFIWRKRRPADGRTRELHEELDGKRFTFAEGHETEGLPGDPHGCRCHAEPVRGD
jgi:hypothetical protein